MLRSLLILAALVPLAACSDDDTDAKRPTRIVCTEGGKTVLDDFATDGVDSGGGVAYWTSATQKGTVRALGTCVAYPQERPLGWKPIMPGSTEQQRFAKVA